MERLDVTSIVLAGGRSMRLGYDKVLQAVGDRSLLEKVLDTVAGLSRSIVVVAAEGRAIPELKEYPGVRVVTDLYSGRGPLVGIYTGLLASTTFRNLVVASDMPFLNEGLLRYMVSLSDGYDAVTLRIGDKLEPLHAVYTRACLGPIERMLEEGELGVHRLLLRIRVRYVVEEEMERFDPERLSLFNVNTERDLRMARDILAGGGYSDQR